MTFHYKQTVIFIESIKSILPFRHLWWGGVCILNFSSFFFFLFWSVKIYLKIEGSYSKWIVLPVHLYGVFCRNQAKHKHEVPVCVRADTAGGAWGAVPWGRELGDGCSVVLKAPPSQHLGSGLQVQVVLGTGTVSAPKSPALCPLHPHQAFSAYKSSCLCQLTMERVGESPSSYWDWAVKSSISVDIVASANKFFTWLGVRMSQGASND